MASYSSPWLTTPSCYGTAMAPRYFACSSGIQGQFFEPSSAGTTLRLSAVRVDNTVRLWSVSSGNLLDTFGGGPVNGLLLDFACAPDRKQIVTARADNSAWVWDVKHGHSLTSPVGHTASIRMARYSDDKKYLVTASEDSTLRVWDASTWKLLSVLDERPAKPAHAARLWTSLTSGPGARSDSRTLPDTQGRRFVSHF